MNKEIQDLLNKPISIRRTFVIWLLVMIDLFLLRNITHIAFLFFMLGFVALFLIVFLPDSRIYDLAIEDPFLRKKLFTILLVSALVLICTAPMGQFPLWNGEKPGHRNQYELMAENLLNGRLFFYYGDEDQLLQLTNPYDPNERSASGISYHWDHAYYEGKYYMYFGIVPVILLFLPYRILTGNPLLTYHATQIFVAFIIIGFFALFHLLAKLFFKKMPYCVYLALSAAFSAMSVWYAVAEPALYCTAITSAIALEIWSIYFFVKAVWSETEEDSQLFYAFLGALLGALVFGCRPTIALANILVIPMLVVFLRQRKYTSALLKKLIFVALPYLLVGIALMAYNYARFEDPFEFGQKYQLTVADQTQYSIALNVETILRIINDSAESFFAFGDIRSDFPYLKPIGVFFNFPILLLMVGVCKLSVVKNMHYAKVLPLMAGIFVTVLAITAMDILWTPYLLERYHMDIYFLLGIGCFLVVGFWYNICTAKQRRLLSACLSMLSVLTVISAFLLCVYRIGVYYPGKVNEIGQILHLIQ